jgi:hypothetical protein
MIPSSTALPEQVLHADVQQFAIEKGVQAYVDAVIDLTRQAFPASSVEVLLGQDAEDETHRYIALEVDVSGLGTDELLQAQRTWSAGLLQICPSTHAVCFVLGWR